MEDTEMDTDRGSPTNKIVICIEGQDQYWNYSSFDLSFDSSEQQILETLKSAIHEHFGVDIKDNYSGWLYKTRKAVDSRNTYLIPNSTAGKF